MKKLFMLATLLVAFSAQAQDSEKSAEMYHINTWKGTKTPKAEIGFGVLQGASQWNGWDGDIGFYASIDMPQMHGFSFGAEAGFGVHDNKEDAHQLAFAAPRITFDLGTYRNVNYQVVGALGIYEHNIELEKYIRVGIKVGTYKGGHFELGYGTLGIQAGYNIPL